VFVYCITVESPFSEEKFCCEHVNLNRKLGGKKNRKGTKMMARRRITTPLPFISCERTNKKKVRRSDNNGGIIMCGFEFWDNKLEGNLENAIKRRALHEGLIYLPPPGVLIKNVKEKVMSLV